MDAFDKMEKTIEFPREKRQSNNQKLSLPSTPPAHPTSPYYESTDHAKTHYQPDNLLPRHRLFGVDPSSPLGVALYKQALAARPQELRNMTNFGWMKTSNPKEGYQYGELRKGRRGIMPEEFRDIGLARSENEIVETDAQLIPLANGTRATEPPVLGYQKGVYAQYLPFYAHMFSLVGFGMFSAAYWKAGGSAWRAYNAGVGLPQSIRFIAAKKMAVRKWKHSLLYFGRMTLLWAATFRALTLVVPIKDESLMLPVSAGIVSLGYTAKRGPYKQLTITGIVVFLGYLAHLTVHEKYDEAPKYLEIEEIAKWKKQNPTVDDFKMLDKVKELRGHH